MSRPTPVKQAENNGPSGGRLLRLVKNLETTQEASKPKSLEQAEAVRALAAQARLAQLALQAAEQGLPTHLTSEFDATDNNPFTEQQVTDAREVIWKAWGQCLLAGATTSTIDK